MVLSAGRAPRGEKPGEWAVVWVTDFGPGIPAAELPHLFEEFYRAEGVEGVEGYGLGLSVARRIACLLGGDLTVQSEAGRGCIFTLWVPLSNGDLTQRHGDTEP